MEVLVCVPSDDRRGKGGWVASLQLKVPVPVASMPNLEGPVSFLISTGGSEKDGKKLRDVAPLHRFDQCAICIDKIKASVREAVPFK